MSISEPVLTIPKPFDIPEQRIRDTLCTGLDPGYGGALYWIEKWERLPLPEGAEKPTYIHDHAFDYGIKLSYDPYGGNGSRSEWETVILNKEGIIKGLKIMASDHPEDFMNLVNENDDAITGDVLVQLSVFGEIVFG